mgnify:CR=1 FL=1
MQLPHYRSSSQFFVMAWGCFQRVGGPDSGGVRVSESSSIGTCSPWSSQGALALNKMMLGFGQSMGYLFWFLVVTHSTEELVPPMEQALFHLVPVP